MNPEREYIDYNISPCLIYHMLNTDIVLDDPDEIDESIYFVKSLEDIKKLRKLYNIKLNNENIKFTRKYISQSIKKFVNAIRKNKIWISSIPQAYTYSVSDFISKKKAKKKNLNCYLFTTIQSLEYFVRTTPGSGFSADC